MDRIHRMSRGRKTLLSLLLVGALGAVAGIGTFSAFSATTVNAGNTFDAGTVVIADNDANSAMYNITAAKPDDVVVRCIQVTYTGSLDSTVPLYALAPSTRSGSTSTSSIDKGTGMARPFPNCTGFTSRRTSTPERSASFAAAHTNFGNGVVANPGAQTVVEPERHARVPLHADAAGRRRAQPGCTSGTHSFTWEAQNV